MPTTETKLGNREKLLRGAMICLRERGYARTTARDLVAASGANLASIGYHFGSKEGLLNEAIAAGMRAWTEEVEAEAFGGGAAGAPERLRRTLAATVDRFDELEPYLRSFVEAFPPALRSPELRARLADAYEHERRAGTAMIEHAAEAEGLSVDASHARVLSSLILALIDGLILQWLLDPEGTPRSAEIMAALAGAVAAFESTPES
jgi:AcrR family transcriptional regulator